MRRPRRQNEPLRVELMPLIDVVFLLLTFFIFALVLVVRVEVTGITLPPTPAGGEPDRSRRPLVLSLTAEGELLLDGEARTLDGAIEEIRTARSSDARTTLFIAADRDAPVGRLLRLVDALRTTGIEDLRFLRTPEDGPAGVPNAEGTAP